MNRESNPQASLERNTLVICGIALAISAVVGLLFVARNTLPLIFGVILIIVVLNRFAARHAYVHDLPKAIQIRLFRRDERAG